MMDLLDLIRILPTARRIQTIHPLAGICVQRRGKYRITRTIAAAPLASPGAGRALPRQRGFSNFPSLSRMHMPFTVLLL